MSIVTQHTCAQNKSSPKGFVSKPGVGLCDITGFWVQIILQTKEKGVS